MSLISIELPQARSTANTFQSSGNTLDDICGHLRQQWSALSSTWEGDSKYDVASEVQALLNGGRQRAEYTRERGVKMTQIADRFQAADENEPVVVSSVTWQASSSTDSILNFADAAFDLAGILDDPLNLGPLKDLVAIPAALTLTFTAGNAYANELIVKGPQFLKDLGIGPKDVKELAGVSENLTNIAAQNLSKHLANQAAIGGVLSGLIKVGPQWVQDVREYQDEGLAKTSAALLVDGVVTVGLSVGTAYVGTYIGATLGTLICPGVGTVIGGAVGKIAAGFVSDALTDAFNQSDLRTHVIDGVTQGINAAAEGVNTAVQSAESAFQHTVDAIQSIHLPDLSHVFSFG